MQQKVTLITFILHCIKQFRWFVTGQVIVAIIWAIDLSLRPYILKLLINEAAAYNKGNSTYYILLLASFYLFMSFIIVLIFRLYDMVWMYLNSGLKEHVILKMMDRLMLLSHSFYQNNFAGKITGRIKDTMSAAPDILRVIYDSFFAHGLAVLIAIYTIGQTNYKLAITMSLWTGIFLSVSLVFAYRATSYCDKASETRASLIGYLVDLLGNMLSVRLFNSYNTERSWLQMRIKEFTSAYIARDWFFLKLFAFQAFSFVIYQAVCIYWLVSGVEVGTITPGDFGLVLSMNISIINCLRNLTEDITKFTELAGDIRQGLIIINAKVEVKDKIPAKELVIKPITDGENFYHPIIGGKIVFEKVEFNYPESPALFQNKTLTIDPGQRVGLVGYSGSGKSTLVNLVLRLFDVTSGRILINGQDIKEVSQSSLRESIAIIPQEPYLFHRSLMDNIRYGKLSASDDEVMEAAKKANAHDFILKLPQGYNTMVGEKGIKLSGGQRQRIAIARAFLKNAPILILDEATSQLDSVTEQHIQESLSQLMEGRTTIVIAHRLSTLLHMDRIIVLDQGRIVEDGTHKELIERNELYASLWETQVNGFLPSKKDE